MTFDDRTTSDWQALDSAHHMAPFTDYGEIRQHGARIITHAEGHHIFDTDGNRILDGMAGLWCVNVGYGRRELVEAATAQMSALPYYNNFFKTSNQPVVALSKKLADLTPDGLNNVFYANSGSEANDTIIRMVRHFWALEGKPEKRVIIGRTYGYHGSTIMSASMGGMAYMHDQAANEPDFEHIRPPYGFLYQGNQDEAEFAANAASWLEDRIAEVGADKVAAFVAEPVQGAGGVIVPPDGYFSHIQDICRRHDILFIADEVITGFGRTGAWSGSRLWGVQPDMMCIAKAITSGYFPLGAALINERIATAFESDSSGKAAIGHGYTYSGHPVGAAAALAAIAETRRLDVVTNAAARGTQLYDGMVSLAGQYPVVGDVRGGHGLMTAMELVADRETKAPIDGKLAIKMQKAAYQAGALIRVSGPNVILSPSLVIEEADIDIALNAVEEGLKAIS